VPPPAEEEPPSRLGWQIAGWSALGYASDPPRRERTSRLSITPTLGGVLAELTF
jgi:hypothetical protein